MIYYIKKESDGSVLNNVIVDLGNLNPFKSWKVEITEYKQRRSNSQNALYWKWLGVIGEHLGYTPDELHEAMKARWLGTEEKKTIFGEQTIKPKSTSKLNSKEFSEYMTMVEAFAQIYDIQLPRPEYYGLE